jgi:hypothetical protein
MSAELAEASVVEDMQEEEETKEAVGLKSPHDDHDDAGDGEADEHTNLAEEITAVINRVAASEFPPVLASKQGGMEPATASQVLTWVDKTHHVKITSYIADQYASFREKASKSLEKPEDVFYAEWIRDTFYVHLAHFYKSQVSDSKVSVSDALALFFGGCNMTPALQHEIDTASKLMQENDLKAFFDFVDRKWKDEVKQVLSSVPKVTEEMRKAWLSESVGYLMRTFIKEGIEDWQPEIMPNELEDVSKRENAERLLTVARLCNEDDIGKVMSRAVDAAYGALPIYAKKSVSLLTFRKNFRIEHYYSLLENYLKDCNGNVDPVLHPVVAPEDISDTQM